MIKIAWPAAQHCTKVGIVVVWRYTYITTRSLQRNGITIGIVALGVPAHFKNVWRFCGKPFPEWKGQQGRIPKISDRHLSKSLRRVWAASRRDGQKAKWFKEKIRLYWCYIRLCKSSHQLSTVRAHWTNFLTRDAKPGVRLPQGHNMRRVIRVQCRLTANRRTLKCAQLIPCTTTSETLLLTMRELTIWK